MSSTNTSPAPAGATRAQSSQSSQSTTAPKSDQGGYAFKLLPGEYRIQVSAHPDRTSESANGSVSHLSNSTASTSETRDPSGQDESDWRLPSPTISVNKSSDS